jgi:uncharacterized membrane protein
MSLRTAFLFLPSIFLLGVFSPLSIAQTPPQTKKPVPVPAAPQSTHYPILLLAFGNEPSWSLRIGLKGPERLDRQGYPPIPLDPGEIAREGTTDTWTYHAKDSATGAEVAVHLTRESCSNVASTPSTAPVPSLEKYSFRANVDHAQIGNLQGCARIATELFPKINNQATDDDDTKNKPAPPTITNFKPPVAVGYLDSTGRVIFSRNGVKKIVAPEGSELSVSHDGRKLLFTRSDSKTGPDRTIVLYDSVTGHSTELQRGLVRQAFWSSDDSHIAFLKIDDEKWRVWTFPVATPEMASVLSPISVTSLQGWTDAHTVLVSDLENAYWIGDDGKPQQTLHLKEVYGDFQSTSSDTIRVHPANADLLLVSAEYQNPNTASASPKDAMGLEGRCFLYEIHSKRRVVLSPPDQWARAAEWSRDGLQVFYTRAISVTSFVTLRIFWDGTDLRRYADGHDLVIGQ